MNSNSSARSYRIQKASEFSGVSIELIRAWERRYGVLKPSRTPGGYRIYTDDDIAVLKRLKQMVDDGMSISEAAKLVRSVRELPVAEPQVMLVRAERASATLAG